MNLPSELLQAVVAAGGGKVTLVVGAGCSIEEPTSIPLASQWSEECHDRLVANHVLADGDCLSPDDLSSLADAVFEKTGSQRSLVDELRQSYPLHAVSPNDGYLIAAAMLSEGAITSVLSLNFDLALTQAVGNIGAGEVVGIVDGPLYLQNQKNFNVYYLHGNANEADPEKWVLRTDVIAANWKDQWEETIANKVLAGPVVVFAGLGSPAGVLIETSRRIKQAIPDGQRAYQVDPIDCSHSAFFSTLGLDTADYVQAGWCDFMEALSDRILEEQTRRICVAASDIVRHDVNLVSENLDDLLERVRLLGLIKFGRIRAFWLLSRNKTYRPDDSIGRELVADLLLAIAFIARETRTSPALCEDGIVEFRRGDQTIAAYVIASGRGSRSVGTVEVELLKRRRALRGRLVPLSGAIVAATSDSAPAIPNAPSDLVRGDVSESILFGGSTLPIFHVGVLRGNPRSCKEVAP